MQDICDISGNGCGLTVAADGIYEYECIDSWERALALTVLWANNRIDDYFVQNRRYELTEAESICEIPYQLALFPHDGDWRGVYQNPITFLTKPVFALNRMPEVSTMTDYQRPAAAPPCRGNAVALSGSNVMITALKKAYYCDSLIVRVLNYGDRSQEAGITLIFPGKEIKAVYQTDLDENRNSEISFDGNRFAVTLRKEQIATFEME